MKNTKLKEKNIAKQKKRKTDPAVKKTCNKKKIYKVITKNSNKIKNKNNQQQLTFKENFLNKLSYSNLS